MYASPPLHHQQQQSLSLRCMMLATRSVAATQKSKKSQQLFQRRPYLGMRSSEKEQEEQDDGVVGVVRQLETLLLLREAKYLTAPSEYAAEGELDLKKLTSHVLEGRYFEILRFFEDSALNQCNLFRLCLLDAHPYEPIRQEIISYLTSNSEASVHIGQLYSVLLLGISYLELYCQCNYTGPELSSEERLAEQLGSDNESEHVKRSILQLLECDGLYPYSAVDQPHLLLLARILLSVVADPWKACWQTGIKLDDAGTISLHSNCATDDEYLRSKISALELLNLPSAKWWCARSIVLHARLLQNQTLENCPTLWLDANQCFLHALQTYCGISEVTIDLQKVDISKLHLQPSTKLVNTTLYGESAPKMVASKCLLEWGLACHHFAFTDKGKKAFTASKSVASLRTELSAALGKRTKYQREDIAQLYLFAESSFVGSRQSAVLAGSTKHKELTAQDDSLLPVAPDNNNNQNNQGWQHADFELGRRLVREAADGEEAAVREVLLDNVDGGAAENIIIEGGPQFADSSASDHGNELHPVDQCIILALCLDVSNSNPSDGLTAEEMLPYIERVLQQPKNWMIHSTGLLERSWLEFERRKTADRAMLQIQALIDQHSTRLSVSQATYKAAVEESAPVNERLRYVYHIVYPSLFEIKRDLATKYLRCQVFMSALNYFRELELWDEVVTCYQLMEKPHRAELVVREQLKTSESPYMLTALADLTKKEEYYERAWELSKHRYARAKRTLGKICYDRGEYAKACEHYDCALSVQPLVHTAWYIKGVACMRLERWSAGVEAFLRCVQQNDEVSEAWSNMGAIHMQTQNWQAAHMAFTEALKQNHDNWRILENLLSSSMKLSKWKEAVRHMSRLVDLRDKSQRPLHVRELQFIAKVACTAARQEVSQSNEITPQDEERDGPVMLSEKRDRIDPLPDLANQVQILLNKITATLRSDPAVWDIVAGFNHLLGRYQEAMEARLKQFRAVINEADYVKDTKKLQQLIYITEQLVASLYFEELGKSDLYGAKMLIQGNIRRLEAEDGVEDVAFIEPLRRALKTLEDFTLSISSEVEKDAP